MNKKEVEEILINVLNQFCGNGEGEIDNVERMGGAINYENKNRIRI